MGKKTFKSTKAAQEFSDNPAMRFITPPVEAATEQANSLSQLKAQVPDGYKVNSAFIEKKSRRVQLVLQPSLYEKAKKAADAMGVSFNEYCHTRIADAVEKDLQEE